MRNDRRGGGASGLRGGPGGGSGRGGSSRGGYPASGRPMGGRGNHGISGPHGGSHGAPVQRGPVPGARPGRPMGGGWQPHRPPHPPVAPPPLAGGWLRPHNPVPLGLFFHFMRSDEMREAKRILHMIAGSLPVAPRERHHLERMFGRGVFSPYEADMLIRYLDQEMMYF